MSGLLDQIPILPALSLTEVRSTDTDAFVEHFRDKEIYDNTLRIPYPYRMTDAEQWVRTVEERFQRAGRLEWALRTGDRLIGAIGFLEDVVIGKSYRAEIGYWLAKPYWGKGYMSAAVKKVVELGFDHFKLVRITALIFAFNAGSEKVLRHCGFQEEGYLKKHYRKEDRFIDAKVFAIVR